MFSGNNCVCCLVGIRYINAEAARLFTDAHATQLMDDHYTIIDHCFPTEFLSMIRCFKGFRVQSLKFIHACAGQHA
jgi:hypothetical protein